MLCILELTVGFESNLKNNEVRKKRKYMNLVKDKGSNFRCVKFVDLSMSSLGVFFNECSTFLETMNHIGIDKKQQHYIIEKMMNLAIGSTYFIFSRRCKRHIS